ncbi:MAG TPA: ABC transporter permease [Bacteroidales bacterium]|nr:ABC transporter permease [Bacteroidales bacterium]
MEQDTQSVVIPKEKSPFRKVISREWRRITRRWALLFATFIGPLFSFLLIIWIFVHNVPRELPVAVVDMDHTQLSRQIARMTDATSVASINKNFTSLEEGRKAVESGDVDAVIYIPAGTEKDIYRGTSGRLALYLNNTNVVKNGLLNSGIRKAIGTLSAGIKLQLQLKSGKMQEQAMSRIMPVQLNSILLFNPYTSYSYYLTVALLPLILIVFVLLGNIYTIGDELYRGTGPKWLRLADKNFGVALAGKLLPYTAIYFCVALLMNVILFDYLGLPLRGNFHTIIVGELLLIVSYQFMAIFFVGLFANMRLAMSIGSAYCMLALTFSGLTFPAVGMPAFGQAFSSIFPFTYWIKLLIGQSLRGEPVSNAALPLLAMVLFIGLGMLFIPRLRYMLLNKSRWGKK